MSKQEKIDTIRINDVDYVRADSMAAQVAPFSGYGDSDGIDTNIL